MIVMTTQSKPSAKASEEPQSRKEDMNPAYDIYDIRLLPTTTFGNPNRQLLYLLAKKKELMLYKCHIIKLRHVCTQK